jgi:hypothetical protein
MFGPYTPTPCQRCKVDSHLVTILTDENTAIREEVDCIITWTAKDCGNPPKFVFCAHCGQMQGDFPKHFLLDYFK